MKVLLGIATFPTEPAVYERTRESVGAMIEQAIADGHTVVTQLYGGDVPGILPADNLCAKHIRMREDVLNGDYDALLTVEADIIVPPDALAKLATVEADIVYGLYCSRQHQMLLCFPKIKGFTGASISAEPGKWRKRWGQIVPSEGVGFGCTLIHRRVLERVSFRHDEREYTKRGFADDWFFALDVKEAGFTSAHHLGVICGHIDRDGRVLWPDAESETLFRWEGEPVVSTQGAMVLPERAMYRVIKPLVGSRYHRPGELLEMDAGAAAILLELGKIARVEA